MQHLTERPRAVLEFDLLAEFAFHNFVLTLEANAKFLLLNNNDQVSGSCPFRNRNSNIDFAQLLLPFVWESCMPWSII